MNLYLDTSGLVKLLARESGSESMSQLWIEAETVWISRVGYVEARAALAAARRRRTLSIPALEKAKQGLNDRWAQMRVIDLTSRLAFVAGDVAEEYGLRANDAVHLCSALVLEDPGLVLATWDRNLGAAGRRAGLAVAGAF